MLNLYQFPRQKRTLTLKNEAKRIYFLTDIKHFRLYHDILETTFQLEFAITKNQTYPRTFYWAWQSDERH